jgi:D-amino-acid oxidase
MKTGQQYTAIMVNVLMYLPYLQSMAETLGATTIRADLPVSTGLYGTLKAAAEIIQQRNPGSKSLQEIAAFVNATGLAARKLVPDINMYPVRGQTVAVAGLAKRITTVDDSPTVANPSNPNITYILPRPHTNYTLLGGTKQANNWNSEPTEEDTKSILERAKQYAPELLNSSGEFEVLGVNVGFRPGRKGGARIETERIGGLLVCHSYGHSGAGYQNSIGSAKKVVRLLKEALNVSEGSASKL